VGIEQIMKRRRGRKAMGFGAEMVNRDHENEDLKKDIEPEDLLGFGLIPEFIGRLPVIVPMEQLSEDELVRVLTEPKNALIKQYQKLMGMDGVDLKVDRDALVAMAREAIKRGTGARALRSILERIMLDVMYDMPGRRDVRSITLTEAVVKGERPPLLKKRVAEKNAA
jgi:ATP-dependent Clp protease ATP-binding subunit ClpX